MGSLIFALLAVALVADQAFCRTFDNPILDNGDYPDPGTIKVDGVYYIVTTTNNDVAAKYPIHTSTDLKNWTLAGYIFTEENMPTWSNKNNEFWAPEIHRVGDSYRVYFTSRDDSSNKLTIGVASAPTPKGPYTDLGRPLFLDPNGHASIDSTLINDNGTLYLLWKDLTGGWIKGRPMNPDGLSFSSDEITDIMTNEYDWEDGVVEGPWYERRGQYHYLYYSGHGVCSDLYVVGIARARSPLGPYEKKGVPILVSNEPFKGPGHNSVVKDLDDVNDIIVFHAYKKGEVCNSQREYNRLTLLATIGWGEDEWPYVYDF